MTANKETSLSTHSVSADLSFLTLQSGARTFALRIQDVLEVVAMVAVTTVTGQHPALLGYLNRHGTPMPLIDLQQVMAEQATEITLETFIVIAQLSSESTQQAFGLVVDDVFQVQYIQDNQLMTHTGISQVIDALIQVDNDLIPVINAQALMETVL